MIFEYIVELQIPSLGLVWIENGLVKSLCWPLGAIDFVFECQIESLRREITNNVCAVATPERTDTLLGLDTCFNKNNKLKYEKLITSMRFYTKFVFRCD